MGYVPKFIHFDHFIDVGYPFGVHMLNELHNINPTTETYILIVRKEEDTSAHCSSLRGIDVVGNFIDAKALKKNSCDDYRKWKGICSRFEYVVCYPKPI